MYLNEQQYDIFLIYTFAFSALSYSKLEKIPQKSRKERQMDI